MNKISRFSISMDSGLLARLDKMTHTTGYANRSMAISRLVEEGLVAYESESDILPVAGTITLVYDHHKRNLQNTLTAIQHDYGDFVISVMHVHLDHHHCLEVLAVRGESAELKKFANRLITVKGVEHGNFTVAGVATGAVHSKRAD
jgi:CopG family nickel-responsive transcriptional regulator